MTAGAPQWCLLRGGRSYRGRTRGLVMVCWNSASSYVVSEQPAVLRPQPVQSSFLSSVKGSSRWAQPLCPSPWHAQLRSVSPVIPASATDGCMRFPPTAWDNSAASGCAHASGPGARSCGRRPSSSACAGRKRSGRPGATAAGKEGNAPSRSATGNEFQHALGEIDDELTARIHSLRATQGRLRRLAEGRLAPLPTEIGSHLEDVVRWPMKSRTSCTSAVAWPLVMLARALRQAAPAPDAAGRRRNGHRTRTWACRSVVSPAHGTG